MVTRASTISRSIACASCHGLGGWNFLFLRGALLCLVPPLSTLFLLLSLLSLSLLLPPCHLDWYRYIRCEYIYVARLCSWCHGMRRSRSINPSLYCWKVKKVVQFCYWLSSSGYFKVMGERTFFRKPQFYNFRTVNWTTSDVALPFSPINLVPLVTFILHLDIYEETFEIARTKGNILKQNRFVLFILFLFILFI